MSRDPRIARLVRDNRAGRWFPDDYTMDFHVRKNCDGGWWVDRQQHRSMVLALRAALLRTSG